MKIITFIYWFMLLGDVGFGLNTMFVAGKVLPWGNFFTGLFYIVIGAVVILIWCELLIVILK